MRLVITLLFLIAIAVPAHAASAPSHRLCNPDHIRQTNAWVDCLQKALDTAEEKLNAAAGRIAAKMQMGDMLEEPTRKENRVLFETAQKQWLSVRDQDCKSYGAHRAGLGFGAVQFRLTCLLDETVFRFDALRSRYTDELD
jgi:uncharacterized protein YecT (DUF1311 family)